MSYPDVLPHDLPQQIAEDLFVVHGCVRLNRLIRFTRNMAVVRDGGKLTLINPVRMGEPGLEKLEALGEVAHVLRLGPYHGMDDAFYVDRYQADFWAFEDGVTYTEPAIDRPLSEEVELPFANAKFFAFNFMRETEGAILLERSPGILLTVDALQSYTTAPHYPHTNLLTRLMMPRIGFPKKTLIGPIWVKRLVNDREGIKREFQRLLELPFDKMLSAHGTFLETGAKAEVKHAYETMFE